MPLFSTPPSWYDEDGNLTNVYDITGKGVVGIVEEEEEVVLASTSLSFSSDATYNTGMYCTAENAIDIGNVWRSWINNVYTKLRVTWDGTDYICYFHDTEQIRYDENGDYSGYYDWHWVGNPTKLDRYEYATNAYPFCITMDRFKNASEIVVWAIDSTAATHTLSITRLTGEYNKAPYEYDWDRVDFGRLTPEGRNSFIVGTGKIGTYASFMAGIANEVIKKEPGPTNNQWATVIGLANKLDFTQEPIDERTNGVSNTAVVIGYANEVGGEVTNSILTGMNNKFNNVAFQGKYPTRNALVGGGDVVINNAVQNGIVYGNTITQNGMNAYSCVVGGNLKIGADETCKY